MANAKDINERQHEVHSSSFLWLCVCLDETDSDCDVDSMDLPSLGPGPIIPNKEADQSRGKPGTSQNPPMLNKHSEWPGAQQPTGPACSPLSHKQSDQRRLKATGRRIQPSVPRRRLESGQQAGDQHLVGQRETDQQVQPGQKKGSKPKRGLTREMKGTTRTHKHFPSVSVYLYPHCGCICLFSCLRRSWWVLYELQCFVFVFTIVCMHCT